jgi:hypothetical protein
MALITSGLSLNDFASMSWNVRASGIFWYFSETALKNQWRFVSIPDTTVWVRIRSSPPLRNSMLRKIVEDTQFGDGQAMPSRCWKHDLPPNEYDQTFVYRSRGPGHLAVQPLRQFRREPDRIVRSGGRGCHVVEAAISDNVYAFCDPSARVRKAVGAPAVGREASRPPKSWSASFKNSLKTTEVTCIPGAELFLWVTVLSPLLAHGRAVSFERGGLPTRASPIRPCRLR